MKNVSTQKEQRLFSTKTVKNTNKKIITDTDSKNCSNRVSAFCFFQRHHDCYGQIWCRGRTKLFLETNQNSYVKQSFHNSSLIHVKKTSRVLIYAFFWSVSQYLDSVMTVLVYNYTRFNTSDFPITA